MLYIALIYASWLALIVYKVTEFCAAHHIFWTIFFIGWLICSVIVALLIIRKKRLSSVTVNVLSAKVDTYGDLLWTTVVIVLGPIVLARLLAGVIDRLMSKPLPWKKAS